MDFDDEIRDTIRKSLGLPDRTAKKAEAKQLDESYVVEPKAYTLKTEVLSDKVKRALIDDFNKHTKALNSVSAKLDTVSRDDADVSFSDFRSLKMSEAHCISESFLRSKFFDNIDDPKSQITMDSLPFMRLERDFGKFDEWQKDFIACGMSSRGGYVVTGYNMFLRRYMNFIVDGSFASLPVGTFPVIVIDVSEGAYYRDYVGDRKTYIIAMMKELNWNTIEERFKRAERIAKVMV